MFKNTELQETALVMIREERAKSVAEYNHYDKMAKNALARIKNYEKLLESIEGNNDKRS